MDKSGTECIRKASQIMNFNDSQKVKGVVKYWKKQQ